MNNSQLNTLVIGATGRTGQEILKVSHESRFQKSNIKIFGTYRNLKKKHLIEYYGATPVLTDLEEDLTNIAKDMNVVIYVAGTTNQDPDRSIPLVTHLAVKKTIDSCIKHNCKRFLFISSLNTGKTKEEFLDQFKKFYKDDFENETYIRIIKVANSDSYYKYLKAKEKAEKDIQNSSLDYTILRAGILTNETSSNKVSVYPNKVNFSNTTSRNSIAKCFIYLLDKQFSYKKTYTVFDGNDNIEKAFS